MSQSVTIPEFVDAETPIQVGSRLYLQKIPSPPSSLQLFKNGLLMSIQAGDYLLTGQVITPMPLPADGDAFIAYYRL